MFALRDMSKAGEKTKIQKERKKKKHTQKTNRKHQQQCGQLEDEEKCWQFNQRTLFLGRFSLN